ncbi:MAG TPA: bifunctional adenosylcobinamide kinase/adenosylcobinamide-phosphate guanylyltransferase [Chloroflexota bacterium]|nr:bifunctional adenosylcobinamide kinase/adenosylcobinamide-phosphate guanylyltransferase [Chloroflexota bacterium]
MARLAAEFVSRSPERRVVLVLGGARSGKSAYAQRLAQRSPPVLFVATATPGDAEMRVRIEAHRSARPSTWTTLEAPLSLAHAISARGIVRGTVLVDCLTLLVSNHLMAGTRGADAEPGDREHLPNDVRVEEMVDVSSRIQSEIHELLRVTARAKANLVAVSDEVGMGIVPSYQSGRVFRDLLGMANQQLAGVADSVYLMVAGIPVDLKSLASANEITGVESGEAWGVPSD